MCSSRVNSLKFATDAKEKNPQKNSSASSFNSKAAKQRSLKVQSKN